MSIYLIGILFAGLFIRLHSLGMYPYWYDEAVTVLTSNLPFTLPQISNLFDPSIHLQRQDHLFLYDLVFVRHWKYLFGSSEFVLRLSSVLWGVMGIYMIYRLARLMYNRVAGLIAALLLSLSPLHVYYSQELRPYTVICFFSILMFYALYKIAVKGKNKYWFIYGIASVICVYINYMMVTFLLASAVALIPFLKSKQIPLKRYFIGHIVIIAVILPVVIVVAANMINGLFKPFDPGLTEFPVWGKHIGFANLLFTLKNFSVGYNTEFFSITGLSLSLIFVFLYIFGLVKDAAKKRVYFNIVLAAFPVSLIFLISIFVKVCYVDRYFFPSLALFIVAISYGLSLLSRKALVLSLAAILLLICSGLKSYYSDSLPLDYSQHIGVVHKNSKIDKLAGFLLRNFQNGDKVYFTSKLLIYPAKFYVGKMSGVSSGGAAGSAALEVDEGKLLFLDARNNLQIANYDKLWPRATDIRAFEPGNSGRIWLINYRYDGRPAIIDYFYKAFSCTAKYDFRTSELYLFSAKQ